MAIRIVGISPKTRAIAPSNSIPAHLAINVFKWVNEQNQTAGESYRTSVFDWIVNKKGKAYIKNGDETIFIFGANASSGEQYIRALKDGVWTDDLLSLPEFTPTT